jgi:DNA-binding Xre family transcriptional regulator
MTKVAVRKNFVRSSEAIAQAGVKGRVLSPYLHEASQPPYLKNIFIDAGVSPVSLWIIHRKLSEEEATSFLGCSSAQYKAMKNDPDGHFSKITPDMVLRLCHNIGVHPAHLGSLEPDFRQSLPPAILAANIKIMRNESGQYSQGDIALANYAIKTEEQRYETSFHDDPEFGRLAEKLDEVDEGTLSALFQLASSDPQRPWELEGLALLACEQVLKGYRLQFEQMMAFLCGDFKKQRVHFYMTLREGLQDTFPNIIPSALVKALRDNGIDRSMQSPQAKQLIKIEMYQLVDKMMREGRNRLLSFVKTEGIQFQWRDALEADIEKISDALHSYLGELLKYEEKMPDFKTDGEILLDEIVNLAEWVQDLQETRGQHGNAPRVVQRLFANRLMMTSSELAIA